MLEVLQIIILVLPLIYAFKQLKYLTFVRVYLLKQMFCTKFHALQEL